MGDFFRQHHMFLQSVYDYTLKNPEIAAELSAVARAAISKRLEQMKEKSADLETVAITALERVNPKRMRQRDKELVKIRISPHLNALCAARSAWASILKRVGITTEGEGDNE